MTNYALTLKFMGTAYFGWQVQKDKATVQSVFQDAAEKTFGSRLGVTGCSRTDSGVHANEFVCHVRGAPFIDTQKLPLALNSRLPRDIAVTNAREVDGNFHARYSATGKEYMYLIWNERIRNPFYEKTALHYPVKLEAERLSELASQFCGRRDFRAFMAAGSDITDTVREIKWFRAERDGSFLRLFVAADGFLYNMVRIMCGTLLQEAGGGSTLPVAEIIQSLDRSAAGPTLPAHGLYLNRVFYD